MPKVPKRTVPVIRPATSETAWRPASTEARVRAACGRSASADSVGTTPRPTRRNSDTPMPRSSSLTCSETDGCA